MNEKHGAAKRGVVYATLAREIVTGVLPPGTPLSERALGERFSLSRTPIRQVLWQLERDLLVEVHENRGAFVAKMGATEILELFQLREALEPVAAMLAATHRPDAELADLVGRFTLAADDPSLAASSLISLGEELHDSLVAWSGNRMLGRIYDSIRMQTQLLRNLLHNAAGVESASLREHLEILDALTWRDKARARRTMTYHLLRAKSAIIEELFGTADPDAAESSLHGGIEAAVVAER